MKSSKKPGMPTGSTRYYEINEDGSYTKHVCVPGQYPEPHWIRGFPPRSEEYTKYFAELMKNVHGGKPKAETQREKMRLRKLGIPKTTAHRTAMSAAHQSRAPRIDLIMKHYPELSYYEASALEAKFKKSTERPEWYDEFIRQQSKV